MRRLVEGHVEILALLSGAGDFAALHRGLEGFGGGADLTVDDVIFESGAVIDRATDEVFAKVVDYARDFAYLLCVSKSDGTDMLAREYAYLGHCDGLTRTTGLCRVL